MSVFQNALGSVLRGGLTFLSKRRLPQIEGTLRVPGLTASVEIIRDRWGIPHLYAANAHDLFFAQGFVHAQDRLWQMELNRRTATGRLSEIFGEVALDTDRAVRTFGFARLAQTDLNNAANDILATLQAYTDGVNAFLQQLSAPLPIEFTLLRHTPEPWTQLDSMAFMRVLVWQLSHAWYGEIVRAQIIQAVGPERAAELEIHYPATNPTTLPLGIEFNAIDTQGLLQAVRGPFLDQGKGSNAWCISGHKTTTGAPLLCNDPHLSLMLPSLWYKVHLVGGSLNTIGVSLPGVPMVLIGHNARLAWGITLAYTDCEDLVIEKLDPARPHKYRFRDELRTAEVVREEIRVKGRTQLHVEEVTITHHGPIISDVIGYSGKRVAVNSMALRPSGVARGWLLLNQAQGWDDFVRAMRLIAAPQLNVAYADVDGNIGYWCTGRVPIRAQGKGAVPVPGWTGEYEWLGEVPFEEMPHALNPQQGYVVTCNQRLVPDDYPHFLGEVWMNGYRARRIGEVFESKGKLSIADMRALQLDFFCRPGLEFVQRSGDLQSDDSDVALALELLRNWDGFLTSETVAGTIYEVARYMLVHNVFETALSKSVTELALGQGFHPLLMTANEFYGHDTVTILRLLDNPQSWWIQQAGGRDAVLTRSLKQAIVWLRDTRGPDQTRWQWGQLHRATFPHALALQKPLDRVFNRGPYPCGGDTDTVCQVAMLPDDPYDGKAWAPTYRQIVDLGDLSRSEWIYAPGQSGQLGHPHYDDLIEPWRKGETIPMLWTREQVEAAAEGKLVLNP
ncbi:penicillin amidase [Thermoflexales bacterium]|nr:penicillin amidase [Thermoflexales bacterium]